MGVESVAPHQRDLKRASKYSQCCHPFTIFTGRYLPSSSECYVYYL